MDMRKKQKRSGDEEDLSLLLLSEQEDLSLLLTQRRGYLIFQILLRLPVVSLLRFKAVCKFWRNVIRSPFFIRFHIPITLPNSSPSQIGAVIVHVICDERCSFNHGIKEMLSSGGSSSSQSDSDAGSSNHEFKEMLSSQSDSDGGSSNHEIKEKHRLSWQCLPEPLKTKHALLMLSSPSDSESSGGGSNDDQEEVVVVDDLGFDMEGMKEIAGSCDGIVCLCDTDTDQDQIYLWNPATRQCMILPESKTNPCATCNILVGFGFDVETYDYKVVQFTGLGSRWNGNGPEFCFCEVQVYSLSTHSWRLLEGIPRLPGYPFQMQDNLLYLNGTCFIIAQFFHTRRRPCLAENDRFIMSFDFTQEIITPIQLPDHHRDQKLCLCSWGGDKIALFTSPNPRIFKRGDSRIDYWEDFNMWVLNYERGSSSSLNKKSWTKLHSFRIQIKRQFEWYVPKGISNDGKFALLQQTRYGYRRMNLYNFATKEVKRDFLFCSGLMSNAHAYKPSLVSVIGGNGAGAAAAADRVIRNGATNL